jgi:hypothetical protein
VIHSVSLMLKCFKAQPGTDTQAFASAIVGILLQYPIDVTRDLCNPFSGLPAQQEFIPSPFDVRQAAEKIMQPRRDSEARAKRIKAQLDERQQIEDQRAKAPRKQTMEEIEDEMHARGLDMPGWKAREKRKIDEKLRAEMSAKYGKAYDDIPDAPPAPEVKGPGRLITWEERETIYAHLPPYNPPKNQ